MNNIDENDNEDALLGLGFVDITPRSNVLLAQDAINEVTLMSGRGEISHIEAVFKIRQIRDFYIQKERKGKQLFESNDQFQILGRSLPLKGKIRCGDYLHYTQLPSEQLVVLAFADGVGSLHHDCDASQTACESFIEFFTNSTISDLSARIEHALKETDKAVSDPVEAEKKGMMCTFIGVIWDMKQNQILYDSIGDSRLYKHSLNGFVQLSTDDKKAVLMRDKSGKLLSQSGALLVREGLTNAFGYNGANVNITKLCFDHGDSLVLCSDGMYDVPDFEKEIAEALLCSNLAKQVEKLIERNIEVFDADASMLILQSTIINEDVIPKLRKAINEKIPCRELDLHEHIVTKWIMGECLNSISANDNLNLEKMTEYVINNELTLSESFIETAFKEMKKQEFSNTKFHSMLISQLKRLKW